MDNKFLTKFAFANLLTHKSRTFLTLLGVTIGISAIVVLVSLAFGIERLVTEEVTGGDALKLVDVGTGSSQVVKLDDETISKISSLSGISKTETVINAAAKAKEDKKTADATLFGTTNGYIEWSGIKVRYGEGLGEYDSTENKALVNTAYLTFLEQNEDQVLGTDKKFDIIIPKEALSAGESLMLEDREFKIVGIVQNDTGPVVYTHQESLMKMGAEYYSQAKIEINDRNKVAPIRKQVENMGLKTQYVGDTVSQIEQIFNVFKIILASFGMIALVVAALGMFNTLTISLMERMKEVALLKILGMSRKHIHRLFLTESLIFGVLGGFLGIALGFFVGLLANTVLNHYAISAGGDPVNVFYYSPWFLISIIVFAIAVSILTGLYPSRRATKVAALDVLRYE